MTNKLKKCTCCKEKKPLIEYYKHYYENSKTGDGYQTQCKDCLRAKARSRERKKAADRAAGRVSRTSTEVRKQRDKPRGVRLTIKDHLR